MWHNLAELARYRGLIQSLVARELKARYRGSVLGFFWSFVNPLLLLGVYTFVFATVLPNNDPDLSPYSVFMFCGILPWTWFSSSLLEATGALISGGNLIKKVLFPAEILPIVSVLASMVHFVLGLPILVIFMITLHHLPHVPNVFWFPAVVLVQLVFTLACALVLSALTVHFRDIRDLLSNLLTLWFFATPIIYRYTQPTLRPYLGWFKINPMFHMIVSYQEALFFDAFGHARSLGYLALLSVAFFLAAYWLFDRLRDSFAEVV
jgi:ABC-type polysaccharide/polyol phosphate export permease